MRAAADASGGPGLEPLVDAAEARDLLVALTAAGPRVAGTPGESAAARWIGELFRDAGLDVEVQPFEVSRWPFRLALHVVPLVAALVLLAAASVLAAHPLVSLAALTALLAFVAYLGGWHRRFASLFDLGDRVASANVLGRSPARGGRRPLLVLVAHLDSRTQLVPMGAQLAALLLGLACAVVLWVTALLVSAGVLGVTAALPLSIGVAGAAGLVVVAANVSRPPSPGALDNASGAVLLALLARTLPARVGDRVDLLFLATGAEELGLGGALRFAQRSAGGLDAAATLCVNFDVLGTPGPVFLAGALRDPLSAGVVSALRARGFRALSLPLLIGAGMDHLRLQAAGLRAVSLTQGLGVASLYFHGAADRMEHVDPVRLAQVGDAVLDLADRVASRDLR